MLMTPFDVTRETFIASYRLTQDLVRSLGVSHSSTYSSNYKSSRYFGVLHFYATGSYQRPTGKSIDTAVAQPTVSDHLTEVTLALNHPQVVSRLIQFPRNAEQMRACVARNQYLGGRFPGAVGYTDGTLVKIMKPTLEDNVQAYIGRKSFASINALVTCDKRFYVMNIVSRYPGATNDSYIWANSALRRKMIELNEEERCFLLGDSGFPS
ncbi:uncharacterized protein LOC117649899 [Thrips palmi]|uniref:Uncharacterized protein LOC117649899 n=1 Tax=Thrips palmi TaxID=161013 RepID=A0A6P8ZUW3_THRPL|nr:uncharacterized protein LOC117649899 [Thrips palmi]